MQSERKIEKGVRKYIFSITPQTNVRSTQGDRIYFKIPRDKLRPPGLKRLMRLERYNQYKIDLYAISKQIKFTPPEQGGHLIFYIPVPRSWSKQKKARYHHQLHQSTPDWDNLSKAFYDSLLTEDKHIADIRVTKLWVNSEHGWIEFHQKILEFASKDNLM
jgi:Holliday junction resolvase RusA-like endonuclease